LTSNSCPDSVLSSHGDFRPAALQVQNWLNICKTQHHPACVIQASLLPSRILDIGTIESPKIVLVVSENLAANYACLSYCWGGAKFYKTTTDNLQKNQRGISPSNLPPAFNQAIQLVRTLGMRYLWIDALCIVQNDDDDWKREASRMADVYANCTLMISLTTLRSPLEIHGLKNERKQVLDVVEIITQEHFPDILGEGSDSFPLFKRAWAFQERVLAPKIVHLGWHELHWECQNKTTCECGYDSDEFYQRIEFHQQNSKMKEDFNSLNLIEGIASMWRAMVTEYSARILTFQTDKLPALSGIAELVRRMRKDDYLAGLWSSTLAFDLCWYASYHDNSSSGRVSIYTAPSWSWASINTRMIYYNLKGSQDTCAVLGYHVVQDGASLTGKVCSGWIMLRTFIMPCFIVKEQPSGDPVLRFSESDLNFCPDAIESWEGEQFFTASILRYKIPGYFTEVALVVRRLRDDELNKPECFCDRQGDRYRRVGIFAMDALPNDMKDLREERTIILV
jgi:hypothetical protein